MTSVPVRSLPSGVLSYALEAPETMVEMLGNTLERSPRKTAFVAAEGSLTWAEFGARVDELAGRLVAAGVVSEDRVGILAPNGLAFTTAVWATWRVGGVVVPLNFRLTPNDLSALLVDSWPRLLLVGAACEGLAAEAAEAIPDLPVHHADEQGRFLVSGPSGQLPIDLPGPGSPAAIMYTSGTTGLPKGVVVSHANAVQNSLTCTAVIGRTTEDIELVMVPQFNITGLFSQTVPVVLMGATAVLLAGFDAIRALDLMEAHGVTSTVGAPTMWWRLLEESAAHDRHELSGLRLALYGGAPMPAAQLARMQQAMPQAVFGNGYGLTETCSMVTFIGGAEALKHPASVGRPLPITNLRIVDAITGADVIPGQTGEVVVRGGQVAQGYWSRQGIQPLGDKDGWVHTGDAAALEDGFVVLRDRIKDVIKRGGESVFSFEIENCLHQHPEILDAAVVGVPDEQYGERVLACVVPKPGHHLLPDEVRAFCRENLAGFKVPSYVEVRDALPRNPGGKVIKSQLRSEFSPSH